MRNKMFKIGAMGKDKAATMLDEINENAQTGTAFLGINRHGGTGYLMKKKNKKKKRK